MKPTPLNELEKDVKFRKKHFPKQFLLKSPTLYLPVAFLFIALVGLVFLLNNNILVSIYAIPFVTLFLFATLWFKTLKKHIQNKFFETPDSFLVCAATILEEDDKMVYLIFTTQSKRHNKFFIEAEAKDLVTKNFLSSNEYNKAKKLSKKTAQKLINKEYSQDEILLKSFNKTEFLKNKTYLTHEKTAPILHTITPNTMLIKLK